MTRATSSTNVRRRTVGAQAAARIAAAVMVLDEEVTAAGIPVDSREALLIGLFARIWDARTHSTRVARMRAVVTRDGHAVGRDLPKGGAR